MIFMIIITDDREVVCNLLAGTEGRERDLFTLKFCFMSQSNGMPFHAFCMRTGSCQTLDV